MTVEVFDSGTTGRLAEVASAVAAMGSTVAYDRARRAARNAGRDEAKRREVVRRAAIVN